MRIPRLNLNHRERVWNIKEQASAQPTPNDDPKKYHNGTGNTPKRYQYEGPEPLECVAPGPSIRGDKNNGAPNPHRRQRAPNISTHVRPRRCMSGSFLTADMSGRRIGFSSNGSGRVLAHTDAAAETILLVRMA